MQTKNKKFIYFIFILTIISFVFLFRTETSTATSCIAPTINYISPSSAEAGSGSVLVTVSGTNFTTGTFAMWNGRTRATIVIDPNKLTMVLTTSDVSTVGTGNIVISNGMNCISNEATFRVGSSATPLRQYPIYYVSVKTEDAKTIDKGSVIINGIVNPNGTVSTAWFEYGTSPTLSDYISINPMNFGSATYFSPISHRLTSLNPTTTYYYRVAAKNYAGTVKGKILSFTIAKKVDTVTEPEVKKTNEKIVEEKVVEKIVTPSTSQSEKKNIFSSWYIWIGILILVIMLAIIFAKRKAKH